MWNNDLSRWIWMQQWWSWFEANICIGAFLKHFVVANFETKAPIFIIRHRFMKQRLLVSTAMLQIVIFRYLKWRFRFEIFWNFKVLLCSTKFTMEVSFEAPLQSYKVKRYNLQMIFVLKITLELLHLKDSFRYIARYIFEVFVLF